jgi:hypothetical protein
MPVIFISHRRDDEADFAGRLADALGRVLGAEVVFRDRDDNRPGGKFAKRIDRRSRRANVTIVVIGPGWLDSSAGSRRRIDDTDDFVAMEVQRAIESGKPVVPVLVGGAQMPSEKELPPALARLARRQAIALSEATWATDLSHLVDALRRQLPAKRRLAYRTLPRRSLAIGAALTLIVVLALSLYAYWLKPATQRQLEQEISGRWRAQVAYDGGVTYEETFNLDAENGEVRGTASYMHWPRLIENGAIKPDAHIDFVTHSVEALGGGAPRVVTHRYRGRFAHGDLDFVLETSGGETPHAPIAFVARRALQ